MNGDHTSKGPGVSLQGDSGTQRVIAGNDLEGEDNNPPLDVGRLQGFLMSEDMGPGHKFELNPEAQSFVSAAATTVADSHEFGELGSGDQSSQLYLYPNDDAFHSNPWENPANGSDPSAMRFDDGSYGNTPYNNAAYGNALYNDASSGNNFFAEFPFNEDSYGGDLISDFPTQLSVNESSEHPFLAQTSVKTSNSLDLLVSKPSPTKSASTLRAHDEELDEEVLEEDGVEEDNVEEDDEDDDDYNYEDDHYSIPSSGSNAETILPDKLKVEEEEEANVPDFEEPNNQQDFEPSQEEYGKFYFGNHLGKKKLASHGRYTEQDLENNLSQISKEINSIGKFGNCEDNYRRALENMRQAKLDKLTKEQRQRADDFPTNPAAQEKMVIALYTAILNTSNVTDKKSKKGQVAQAVSRMTNGYYQPNGDNKELVMHCWRVLFCTRDAQMGLKLTPAYHKSHTEKYDTFSARWNTLIKGCKNSKALCKQVLDPMYTDRIAESPNFETQMKANNQKINGERDKQNALGRVSARLGLNQDAIEEMYRENAEANKSTSGDGKGKRVDSKITTETPSRPTSTLRRGSSTGKRKLMQLTINNDDSDELPNTPTKKRATVVINTEPRSSMSFVTRSGQRKQSGLNFMQTTPQAIQFANTRVAHNNTGIIMTRGQSNTMMGNDMMMGSSGSSSMSYAPLTNFPAYVAMPMEVKYKKIICQILRVDYDRFRGISLFNLRMYARAYNHATCELVYRYGGQPFDVQGIKAYNFNTQTILPHFAMLVSDLSQVAYHRGDLLPNGIVPPMNASHLFKTIPGDIETEQALGLQPNPCGTIQELVKSFAA